MNEKPVNTSTTVGAGSPLIRELTNTELGPAVDLAAQGMCDNPLHVVVFGSEVATRQARLRGLFKPMLEHVQRHGVLWGAFASGELIGVLGALSPGKCRAGRWASLCLGWHLLVSQPATVRWRLLRWLLAWVRADATRPHWHLGPLVVQASHRRQGRGRALMLHACSRIDADGAHACLETDLAINAAFYRSLGFVLRHRQPVLGVDNWFMQRPPSIEVTDAERPGELT